MAMAARRGRERREFTFPPPPETWLYTPTQLRESPSAQNKMPQHEVRRFFVLFVFCADNFFLFLRVGWLWE